MFEATANEFPFVSELPRREKSAVGKALDILSQYGELTRKHGTLVPSVMASSLLDISPQRLLELIYAGRFEGAVQLGRWWYIPEKALLEHAKTVSKKGGRRPKSPTFKECLTMAREMTRK